MVSAPGQTDHSGGSVRVRFAPSPTGALHIGGARTALFNWLLARHAGGRMVLRIEDTDRERSTPENVEQILDSLRWLELGWDEGPILQSERAGRHGEALQALLEAGLAYRSNATAEDVKAYKQLHGAERGFRGDPEASGAVRLRVPAEGATVVHDVIRGETRFEHVHLDDPVIARADGSVLYNFAVAIDDLDAHITHGVRGEDHLSNTPKQVLVLDAAKAVGLAIESGERRTLSTLTGTLVAYGHEVSLGVLGLDFELVAYFYESPAFRRSVLGRTGWLPTTRLGIVDYDQMLYLSRYDD